MAYQHILFDLDGTLTDSKEGIFKGFLYALSEFGIAVPDLKQLEAVIGPPIDQSFRQFFGLSEEDTVAAVKIYREYYKETGLYENEVYPGIEELLKKLKKEEKNLLVATSKPEPFARRILEHFDLAKYFTFIGGSGLKGERNSKTEVIRYALKEAGITDTADVVMVGDRKHDMIGAQETNLSSIGVLYGYGDSKELLDAGAGQLAKDTDELFDLLVKL
ncbi:MAG: HAD family hydrolase [Lachnospiraceae bacterium]|nr:HAD family hydrolase [Lachnospiraceae bacterium]